MTTQERKGAAMEAYKAIREPALEDYKAIQELALEVYEDIQALAWKDYEDIQALAWKAYKEEIERIDNEPDEDIIEVDGKWYQLIK